MNLVGRINHKCETRDHQIIIFRKYLTMGRANKCPRTLVNNPVKESFYRGKKKKINVFIAFFIYHKNDVKTFLKWILTNALKALVSIFHNYFITNFFIWEKNYHQLVEKLHHKTLKSYPSISK